MLNFSLCKYAFGNDVPDKRERPYKQQVATSTRSISRHCEWHVVFCDDTFKTVDDTWKDRRILNEILLTPGKDRTT